MSEARLVKLVERLKADGARIAAIPYKRERMLARNSAVLDLMRELRTCTLDECTSLVEQGIWNGGQS